MPSTSPYSPAHFLARAFDLVRFDPAGGLLFGMKNAKWEEVEEMVEAARHLAEPAGRVMEPLEPATTPTDLARRWYLDTYTTGAKTLGSGQVTNVLLGGGQYSRFSPLKCLGEGKKISMMSLRQEDRPFQLAVELGVRSIEAQIEQREAVGMTRDARALDGLDISIRFLRNNFLKRVLGFPEKEGPKRLPWETDDFDPLDSLELALRLAALIFLKSREDLKAGFIVAAPGGGEERSLISDFLKELPFYDLRFGPRGGIRLQDQRGRYVMPKDCRLEGPNFLIASRALVGGAEIGRPALTIAWNPSGFSIDQKICSKGMGPLPKLMEIFGRMEREVERQLASFDDLPEFDRMALSAEYYSVLHHEKRGLA